MNTKLFTQYLESKNLSKSTQKGYLRQVSLFLAWFNKDITLCTKKDILNYLDFLKNKLHQQNITRNNALVALNHYFTFLKQNNNIENNPTTLLKIRGKNKKTLYNLYSTEQLEQMYDNYFKFYLQNYDDSQIKPHNRTHALLSRQRNYIMLGFLIFQGLVTDELEQITLSDLDLNKALVTIKGSKKSNERKISLKACQMGALLHYINSVRPQFFNFCQPSEQLLLPLPSSSKENQKEGTRLMGALKRFTQQIKTLDKTFKNFKQVRTSVITHWLKTEGLRKTQYLAGHRFISATERYLVNDLQTLKDDIAKHHPLL